MFATDQEYTMFALLAAGQFGTAEDGLRSLAQVSIIANHDSGKVVHETVTDGSVYFGLNDEPGDVDETAKFPDAVAMVWRWTGDNAFRDQMYAFTKKNMQYMVGLIKGDDPWPAGAGNVESSVLGPQLMQRWWTGVTPMEAQLYPDGVPTPGPVPPSEALPALKLRETSCYSGTYGLYVEGGPGCDLGTYTGHTQQAYTLNTGVMAVGLGNYGLLGPGQQQRYTDDLAQLTLNGSPAHYTVRDTNAGREVLVSTPCRGQTWRVHVVGG